MIYGKLILHWLVGKGRLLNMSAGWIHDAAVIEKVVFQCG